MTEAEIYDKAYPMENSEVGFLRAHDAEVTRRGFPEMRLADKISGFGAIEAKTAAHRPVDKQIA